MALTPEQVKEQREKLGLEPWLDEVEAAPKRRPLRGLAKQAFEAGIPYKRVMARRLAGWPPERWFAPIDHKWLQKTPTDQIENIRYRCLEAGITYAGYKSRRRAGLPDEVLLLPKDELNTWKMKHWHTHRGGNYGRGDFRGKLSNKNQAFTPTQEENNND